MDHLKGGARRAEADRPPVVVRLVRPDETRRWAELMVAHHYLGFRILVGESLKYVAEQEGSWLALLGWGAAAFKCGPRDAWIGWTKSQQWRRLRYVANNRASRHSCGRATRKVERSRLVGPGIFVVLKKLMGRVRFRDMGEPSGKGGTAVRLLLLSGL
ncbi:MAG: Druantia anti-phage system protein DruA [Candidatus Dormibacteria bacterium]